MAATAVRDWYRRTNKPANMLAPPNEVRRLRDVTGRWFEIRYRTCGREEETFRGKGKKRGGVGHGTGERHRTKGEENASGIFISRSSGSFHPISWG